MAAWAGRNGSLRYKSAYSLNPAIRIGRLTIIEKPGDNCRSHGYSNRYDCHPQDKEVSNFAACA